MTDISSIKTKDDLLEIIKALQNELVEKPRTAEEYFRSMQSVIFELSHDLEVYGRIYSIASNVRALAGLNLDRLVNRYMSDDFSDIDDVFKQEKAAKRKAKTSNEQLFLLQTRAIEKETLNQYKVCKQKLIACESNKKVGGY